MSHPHESLPQSLHPASLGSVPSYSPNADRALQPLVDAVADLVEQRQLARTPEVAQEWFAIESVARYLDVAPERVRKLVARRAIPYYQEGPGCRVHLRRRELDEWMLRSRVAARPERHG